MSLSAATASDVRSPPIDGVSGPQPLVVATLLVGNTTPTVSDVIITPSAPIATDTLTCAYRATNDVDGSPDVSTLTWTDQSGAVLGVGPTLSGSLSRGDVISCQVTADDAEDLGNTETDTVTVQNAPPSLGGCTIGPTSVRTTDDIAVLSLDQWYDADTADATPNATYVWTLNGVMDPSVTGAIFPASKTTFGDLLSVECTPDDGIDGGNPVVSNTLIIENSPPSIDDCTLSPLNPTTDEPPSRAWSVGVMPTIQRNRPLTLGTSMALRSTVRPATISTAVISKKGIQSPPPAHPMMVIYLGYR